MRKTAKNSNCEPDKVSLLGGFFFVFLLCLNVHGRQDE